MAVPRFEDFLYPFLYQLKDREVSMTEMKDALMNYFNLTEEDCALRTKSGSTFQFNDRIGWSRQWLRRALFIEIPQRGIYRITQRGKDYLKNHTSLNKDNLLNYPEFKEYAHDYYAKNNPNNKKTVSEEDIKDLTPTEQMDYAYKKINDDLSADLLQKVLEMSPSFFEKMVLDLLLSMGYGGKHKDMSHVTPISHDNGVDGIIPEDALGLDKIYIQAKRYKTDSNVGKPEIQQFIGALEEQKATKGVFITTSKFTMGAIETANKASKKIVLLDGKDLADYMIEYNVGVSDKKVFKLKKMDLDYFEE